MRYVKKVHTHKDPSDTESSKPQTAAVLCRTSNGYICKGTNATMFTEQR